MTTYEIEISISDILNGAVSQSGEDFRGLRASNGSESGVDGLFRDYVISHGDDAAMREQIGRAMRKIYGNIKAYCDSFTLASDKVTFKVASDDTNAETLLESYLKWAIIDFILAWWYANKSADRSALYEAKYEEQMSSVRDVAIPKFSTRKLRYF